MKTRNLSGLSLVIFAYNEAGTLLETTEKALQTLQEICPDNSELIIVDDGSTDDTSTIISQLKSLHPQIIVRQFGKNKGIGEALKEGYSHATKEFVCAIPADGQFDLEELKAAPFPTSDEVVYFSRRFNKVYETKRKTLTSLNRIFNKYVLGLSMRDVNWVKLYHTATIHQLELKCSSSLIESEICAKLSLLGLKFTEVPSNYLPRGSGESKGATATSITRVLIELWKVYKERTRFKNNVANAVKLPNKVLHFQ